MLSKQQRQPITYKTISIYEQTYQLPVLKNTELKTIQKKIKEIQRLIKEGYRYYHPFGGIIKRKEPISQGEIFEEIKSLIQDYAHLINYIESYNKNYRHFLFKLRDDLKKLFLQKYLEIKRLDDERKNLEIQNSNNQNILEELKWEKQENFQAILLLSNAYFLMLEKIELLDKGIQKLTEDTKNQQQAIQQICKELEVYQKIYEYKKKSQKIRQEITKIANIAINFESYLQDYFNPFQSLIDKVVKIDENFYATVSEVQNLIDNVFKSQSSLFSYQKIQGFSETFLDFMVASYEKKERLKDAFIQSRLLSFPVDDFEFSDNCASLDQAIESISNYISKQLPVQKKVLGIAATNFVSTKPLSSTKEIKFKELTKQDITFAKEFKSHKNIDYTQLQNFLTQRNWKEADMETSKLMLEVIGKNYWDEVYPQDIDNFSCRAIHTIDQLWRQYSHNYFGFSVQQSIWSEVGGQVDYETEKKLGDRLGWRNNGNWLNYHQLTFDLSPTTPMGHLPAKWLHYDQHTLKSSPKLSAENHSMGAWRVGSWLIWQMHLFFSRVKNCYETFPSVNSTFLNNSQK